MTKEIKYRGRSTGKLKYYPKGRIYVGRPSYSFITDKWSIVWEDEHGWNIVEVDADSLEPVIEDERS